MPETVKLAGENGLADIYSDFKDSAQRAGLRFLQNCRATFDAKIN